MTDIKIKCPKCGAEYLPAELYVKDAFFGRPARITKDEKGLILGFDNESMNVTADDYICDFCDTKFSVTAKIDFVATEVKDEFEDEF